MNYIQELNAFRNYLYMNKMPANAISLWHALMTIKPDWVEEEIQCIFSNG